MQGVLAESTDTTKLTAAYLVLGQITSEVSDKEQTNPSQLAVHLVLVLLKNTELLLQLVLVVADLVDPCLAVHVGLLEAVGLRILAQLADLLDALENPLHAVVVLAVIVAFLAAAVGVRGAVDGGLQIGERRLQSVDAGAQCW